MRPNRSIPAPRPRPSPPKTMGPDRGKLLGVAPWAGNRVEPKQRIVRACLASLASAMAMTPTDAGERRRRLYSFAWRGACCPLLTAPCGLPFTAGHAPFHPASIDRSIAGRGVDGLLAWIDAMSHHAFSHAPRSFKVLFFALSLTPSFLCTYAHTPRAGREAVRAGRQAACRRPRSRAARRLGWAAGCS